jgi:phosphatidylglycerophosphate synthase
MAVIIADIGDGVLARRFNVDTNGRRILDVVVDRVTIHTAFALLMWLIPESIALVTPIIIRDVVLILRNWWLLKAKRVIITPGIIHRTGTVLYAVLFATILFTTGPVAIWISVVISAVVWFLLLDYLRAGVLVPAYPKGDSLHRYQARGLLALRGHVPPLIDNAE